MKQQKWVLMGGVVALLMACGENSTKTVSESKDTALAPDTRTTTTIEVPATARTSFETKYPAATNVEWKRYNEPVPVEWELTDWPRLDTGDYVVLFDYDGYDYYSWYDESGNWISSSYTMPDHSQLPAAVNNAIKSQFAGYTIVEVDKEIDKNRSAYEVELQKGDDKMKVLFAENGDVIKKKSRTAA